jgi:hypothetical protein
MADHPLAELVNKHYGEVVYLLAVDSADLSRAGWRRIFLQSPSVRPSGARLRASSSRSGRWTVCR